jgi:hypothetical protein
MIVGASAFILGLREFGKSYSATRWPIAPGRITGTQIVPQDGGSFAVTLAYEYLLAGRLYYGSGLRSPSTSGSTRPSEVVPTRASAESLVAMFPRGQEVRVGYDPGDPGRSALYPTIVWWSIILLVAGAGLTAGAYRAGRTILSEPHSPGN